MGTDDRHQLSVRLSADRVERLKAQADARTVSVNRLVTAAVDEWLDTHENDPFIGGN